MPLNLLPWREFHAKAKIHRDLSFFILALALFSVLGELGLLSIDLFQQYLLHQKNNYQEKLLAQHASFEKAQQAQTALKNLKELLATQKTAQQAWKTFYESLKNFSEEKPPKIQLSKIYFEKNVWRLEGKSKDFEALNQYQNKLTAKKFKVNLQQWKPNAGNNEPPYFELQISS
jgi:Tfp pilus assembly protein PilN